MQMASDRLLRRSSVASRRGAAISTSTPARERDLVNMPAPLPTPALSRRSSLRSMPIYQDDSNDTRLDGFVEPAGFPGAEDTQLLGQEFGGGNEVQSEADFDDTMVLQQRAFASMPGAGLGGRVLDMLTARQQPAATTPQMHVQDTLERIELGNASLRRASVVTTDRSPSKRSASRRINERTSLGPGGESMTDFETDVVFDDQIVEMHHGSVAQQATQPTSGLIAEIQSFHRENLNRVSTGGIQHVPDSDIPMRSLESDDCAEDADNRSEQALHEHAPDIQRAEHMTHTELRNAFTSTLPSTAFQCQKTSLLRGTSSAIDRRKRRQSVAFASSSGPSGTVRRTLPEESAILTRRKSAPITLPTDQHAWEDKKERTKRRQSALPRLTTMVGPAHHLLPVRIRSGHNLVHDTAHSHISRESGLASAYFEEDLEGRRTLLDGPEPAIESQGPASDIAVISDTEQDQREGEDEVEDGDEEEAFELLSEQQHRVLRRSLPVSESRKCIQGEERHWTSQPDNSPERQALTPQRPTLESQSSSARSRHMSDQRKRRRKSLRSPFPTGAHLVAVLSPVAENSREHCTSVGNPDIQLSKLCFVSDAGPAGNASSQETVATENSSDAAIQMHAEIATDSRLELAANDSMSALASLPLEKTDQARLRAHDKPEGQETVVDPSSPGLPPLREASHHENQHAQLAMWEALPQQSISPMSIEPNTMHHLGQGHPSSLQTFQPKKRVPSFDRPTASSQARTSNSDAKQAIKTRVGIPPHDAVGTRGKSSKQRPLAAPPTVPVRREGSGEKRMLEVQFQAGNEIARRPSAGVQQDTDGTVAHGTLARQASAASIGRERNAHSAGLTVPRSSRLEEPTAASSKRQRDDPVPQLAPKRPSRSVAMKPRRVPANPSPAQKDESMENPTEPYRQPMPAASTSMTVRCEEEDLVQAFLKPASLTEEALQKQERLHLASAPAGLAAMHANTDHDASHGSETLRRYLQDLHQIDVEISRENIDLPAGSNPAQTKKKKAAAHIGEQGNRETTLDVRPAKRTRFANGGSASDVIASSAAQLKRPQHVTAPPLVQSQPPVKSMRSTGPGASQVHVSKKPLSAAPKDTARAVSKPFTFTVSGREQQSFQERLATWQARELQASREGRPALQPISAANVPRKRPLPSEKVTAERPSQPVKVKAFTFASDKRMQERREWEARLRVKEKILAELAEIKRLEEAAKQAEDLRKYRAQQIPRANPLPAYITGKRPLR